MKRHRTHQIDELAQQFFRAAIPVTWSYNEHKHDYGKDYLVEIGNEDGKQTGLTFFVQLKGQEKVEFTPDKSQVKFSLKKKHAAYYVDKVKDLPVFLVVVDVNAKKGWYHFLQPGLETDRSWQKQKSVTVYLPVSNDLADTSKLRQAVEGAKRTMRLLHPESIQDAVVAHKGRIQAIDPRFDVTVSLAGDAPVFQLMPKEPVPLHFDFKGPYAEMKSKITDLMEKGALVQFQPGEVKIAGTKLFEAFETGGGSMQCAVDIVSTVTLVCKDGDGREMRRLSDVPGRFTGGIKELWFEGGLDNSPFFVKGGPFGPGLGGSITLKMDLFKWNNQRMLQLAYFDRLFQFFKSLPESSGTEVEFQYQGNRLFAVTVPMNKASFAVPMGRYMTLICKARKLAEQFRVNPLWDFKAFDNELQEHTEQLYGVFFEGGWEQKAPGIQISGKSVRKILTSGFHYKAKYVGPVRFTSAPIVPFAGEKIEVGQLVHDFSEMTIAVKDNKSATKKRRAKETRNRKRSRFVNLVFTSSENTVMRIRKAEPTDG